MQCPLNVYSSDMVVRKDWGVENTPAKSESIFALHADTLSFKSIDFKYLLDAHTWFLAWIANGQADHVTIVLQLILVAGHASINAA